MADLTAKFEAMFEEAKKLIPSTKVYLTPGVKSIVLPINIVLARLVAHYCARQGVGTPVINFVHVTAEASLYVKRKGRALSGCFDVILEEAVELEGVKLSHVSYKDVNQEGEGCSRWGLRVEAESHEALKAFIARAMSSSPLPSKEAESYSLGPKGEIRFTGKIGKSVEKMSVLSTEQERLLARLEVIFGEENKKRFKDAGVIPHHNLLFEGLPGSGKSNLANLIALRLGRRCVRVDIVTPDVLNYVRENCVPAVFVFEDADVLVSSRNVNEKSPLDTVNLLGALLALLDRSEVPHLFILTTNYPSKLDVALSRSGRIGTRLTFGWARKEDVLPLCLRYLPESLAKAVATKLGEVHHVTLSMVANFCQKVFFDRVVDPDYAPSEEDYATFKKEAAAFEEKWNSNPIVPKPAGYVY